uniref:Uncharacterized protein n=1 Tax=Rhizophora mucronata TaxID=61149 RepID=A0A2P2QN44_RHIMU
MKVHCNPSFKYKKILQSCSVYFCYYPSVLIFYILKHAQTSGFHVFWLVH